VKLALVWTGGISFILLGQHISGSVKAELLIYEHGFGFSLGTCQYGLFAAGLFFFGDICTDSPVSYRWQIVMLILGTFNPFGGSIIYLLGLG
jgi:hypothetical protein